MQVLRFEEDRVFLFYITKGEAVVIEKSAKVGSLQLAGLCTVAVCTISDVD